MYTLLPGLTRSETRERVARACGGPRGRIGCFSAAKLFLLLGEAQFAELREAFPS